MARIYFTKSLPQLDLAGWIAFCRGSGIDGLDMAVRPKYPVNPENAVTKLPEWAKALKDAGLVIGLVTAPTDLTNAEDKRAIAIFEACAKSGVGHVKIREIMKRTLDKPEDLCPDSQAWQRLPVSKHATTHIRAL